MSGNLDQRGNLVNQNEQSYQDDLNSAELKNAKNFEKSLTLPVKDQLQNLEDIMKNVQKESEYTKKELNNISNELFGLKQLYGDSEGLFETILKKLSNEKNRISTEIRRGGEQYHHEYVFQAQQLNLLNQDKQKLEETEQLLDLRVQAVENDVGFRFTYD